MATKDGSIAIADQILAASEFGLPHFTQQERRREKEFLINACRGARRFFLDDEVTKAASVLGQSHPEILIEALRRARTPFRLVLLDYSPIAFVEANGGHAAADAPPRTLVMVAHVGDSRYRLTPLGTIKVAADSNKTMAFAQAVSILYDLETPIGPHADQDIIVNVWTKAAKDRGIRVLSPEGHSDFVHVEFSREHATEMVRSCLFGGGQNIKYDTMYGSEATIILEDKKKKVYLGGVVDGIHASPMPGGDVIAGEPLDKQEDEEKETRRLKISEFKSHASHQLTPCNALAYRRMVQEQINNGLPYTGSSIGDVIAEAVNEYSGQWQFIVCALYLINGQDFVSDTPWKGGSGQRLIHGNIIPYLEHRRVSLKVPRLVVIHKATRMLGEAIPRRRHEVCGHWKHRRGKGDPSCVHVWVKMTENREQCPLCAYDRWWMPDHERGDAALGYVTKDRIVETR